MMQMNRWPPATFRQPATFRRENPCRPQAHPTPVGLLTEAEFEQQKVRILNG
jgi:hypothetical protein